MIKNVIFDLGGVMLRYNPVEFMRELGYGEEKIHAMMEHVFNSKMWAELDRGTYTFGEAIEIFCRTAPELEHEVKEILQQGRIFPMLAVMPSSLEFFMDVKRAGYKIYILTNYSSEGFAYVRERNDFFDEADGIVVSAYVGMIKPEKKIFFHIRDKYGIKPEETVFIDDSKANIEAADEIGFKTILFTGVENCRETFDKLRAGEK